MRDLLTSKHPNLTKCRNVRVPRQARSCMPLRQEIQCPFPARDLS
jgi:hypothetical protein